MKNKLATCADGLFSAPSGTTSRGVPTAHDNSGWIEWEKSALSECLCRGKTMSHGDHKWQGQVEYQNDWNPVSWALLDGLDA